MPHVNIVVLADRTTALTHKMHVGLALTLSMQAGLALTLAMHVGNLDNDSDCLNLFRQL